MFSTWHVIRTKPQAEKKAARELRRVGLRVYVPQQTTTRRRRRKPLLVGYLLVRFPLRLMVGPGRPFFDIVHDDKRVATYVMDWLRWRTRTGDRVPVPLDDRTVQDLIRRQRNHEFDDEAAARARREAQWAELKHAMRTGAQVRVIDGAFESFMAIIESLDRDDKGAWVRVNIFGRETRVHMEEPAQQLEPLEKTLEPA
jgi:transcription antitermination factor NusG